MRQLELAQRRLTYVAVNEHGDSMGERILPTDASFFPQPKATDETQESYEYDSCVGTIHVSDVAAAEAA